MTSKIAGFVLYRSFLSMQTARLNLFLTLFICGKKNENICEKDNKQSKLEYENKLILLPCSSAF